MAQAQARITNLGAQKTSEQLVFGRNYQIKYFMVGSAGHDPATGLPVVPDQTLTDIPSPGMATKALISAYGSASISSPRVVTYSFQLTSAIVTASQLSSIGLYAEIISVADTADSGLIGTVFLHSIVNFALTSFSSSETKTLTFNLNSI